MEIVVLVKQVPDTESLIQIAGDGKTIKTDDIKWVMNPYDEFAVEEALRIRDAQGGTVTILTAGPQKATETIRTALAMGADKGVHINDAAAEGSDGLATAKLLSAALQGMPYDLIIGGMRAVDEDKYQVASAVAEYLGIPQITQVIKEEVSEGKITCESVIEGGTLVTEASLPVLFTAQRGLNEPRYASLPGIMKAKKKPIEVKSVSDLGVEAGEVGLANNKVQVLSLSYPSERTAVQMIEGETADDQAAALVKILKEEAKVI
jgi:electron transfer flavoprotein beta subunit